MSRSTLVLAVLAAATGLSFSLPGFAADKPMPGKTAKPVAPTARGDGDLIRSAMQAAPAKVAANNAAIVAMDAKGGMRSVRAGSNGFTCMADNPATPGPDPMCMDQAAWEWAGAWMGHKTPAAGRIGFMYMLSGGTDASNTDPYSVKPAAGSHWVKTGPHVMIVGAEPAFYDMYPKSAQPDTAVPYVMWAGTPYQHLMIPIK